MLFRVYELKLLHCNNTGCSVIQNLILKLKQLQHKKYGRICSLNDIYLPQSVSQN
jgi:hypothetical protein